MGNRFICRAVSDDPVGRAVLGGAILLEKLRDCQRLLLGFEYAWAWPQGEPMDSVMTDVRAEVDRLRQLGWQVSVTGSLTPRPEVVFRLESISEAAA
jgi:hypothetical protein